MESRTSAIKNLVIGAVIGMTSMLPGLSGATMAVVFGVYERIIRDLSDLKSYLVKDLKFIVILITGALLGTIICAKVLNNILDDHPVECLMFFIGLISGQIPMLCRTVRNENRGNNFSRKEIAVFLSGLALMGAMTAMTLVSSSGEIIVEHDASGILLMFIIGIIVAISAILPGLSHSTILLVIGLLDAFLTAVSDFDLILLVPLMAGLTAGGLGFARLFQKLLTDHHLSTMMFILALTLGSIAVITANIAVTGPSSTDIAIDALFLMLGTAISLISAKQ